MLPKALLEELNRFYAANFQNVPPIGQRSLAAFDAWAIVRHSKLIGAAATDYITFSTTMLERFRNIEIYFSQMRSDAASDHADAVARPGGWAGPGCLPLALALYCNAKDAVPGNYIECGVFRGGSLACLSHAASWLGIKAIGADTFSGLPTDDETGYWKRGQFLGRLDEVKKVIVNVGVPDAVEYRQGLFADTLPVERDPVSVLFLDTDLYTSSMSALRALQHRMSSNTYIASDGVSGANDFSEGSLRPFNNEAKAIADYFGTNPVNAIWTGNGNMTLFRSEPMLYSSAFIWQLVMARFFHSRFEDQIYVTHRNDALALRLGSKMDLAQANDFVLSEALQLQTALSYYVGHCEWQIGNLQAAR